MGLDTTHDAWHGAYSAFNRWRTAVTIAGGYRMRPPNAEERAAYVLHDMPDIDWSIYTDENYQGEWDNGPFIDDPLLHLIVHSDCDGVIHPKHGRPLAARLEELLPRLNEDDSGGHIWSMREVTQRFIDGLRKAAAAGEDVEFR